MGVLLNTLIPRRETESRATFKDNSGWLADWVRGGIESASGEHVNPTTALAISAYFACIRNIAEDIAKMPLPVMRDNGERGRETVDHPASRMLNFQPNPWMTPMVVRETIISHALGYQGGFAEIIRDQNGQASGYFPIDPTTVRVDTTAPGEVRYYVQDYRRNVEVFIPQRNMFHIHGLGHDGITGFCIATLAKNSFGVALAAQKSAAAFFKNGAVGTGHIELPNSMKKESLMLLRDQFAERHGGAANFYKPIILEHGAKFVTDTFDPEKSQLTDTMQFSVEDVARWFRMPPHKIGQLLHATYSNIEHSNRQYADETLSPWATRFEQEGNIKFFTPGQRGLLYIRHNFKSLMKGDSAARSAFYKTMLEMGAYNANRILELEDENPIGEDGDHYWVSANLKPVNVALTEAASNTDMTPAEQDKQVESVGEAITSLQIEYKEYIPLTSAIDRMVDSYGSLLEATYARVLRIEHEKAQRARSKGNYEQWAGVFYKQHISFVQAALGDVVNAILKSVLAVSHPEKTIQSEKITLISYALADRHTERSKASDNGWLPDARAIEDAATETEFIKAQLKGAML